MTGSQNPEVAVVQGCQLRLIQTFDYRKDSCIYEPYVGVRVAITYLSDAPVVLRLEFFDVVSPSDDIV